MCIGSSSTPAIGSAAPTSTLLGSTSIGGSQSAPGPVGKPGAPMTGVGTYRGTILGGNTHDVGTPRAPTRSNSL